MEFQKISVSKKSHFQIEMAWNTVAHKLRLIQHKLNQNLLSEHWKVMYFY